MLLFFLSSVLKLAGCEHLILLVQRSFSLVFIIALQFLIGTLIYCIWFCLHYSARGRAPGHEVDS